MTTAHPRALIYLCKSATVNPNQSDSVSKPIDQQGGQHLSYHSLYYSEYWARQVVESTLILEWTLPLDRFDQKCIFRIWRISVK
jgi:hypothetical protein